MSYLWYRLLKDAYSIENHPLNGWFLLTILSIANTIILKDLMLR